MKKHETTEQEVTKEAAEMAEVLELVHKGIVPVKGCKLYTAIDGEEEFSITSLKTSRHAKMFYTHMGLVMIKTDTKTRKEETIIVPPATVAYLRIKKPE
jgi:hypothetical protein